MPTYDCPEDWLSDSSTLYMQIGGNTNYSVGNHIQKQQGGNVSNNVVNIPGCQKISAFGTYDWPAGDYCIIAVKCPPDFYPGHIGLHEEGDYIYHFYFCCRNDGLSSAPIKLPTTMPFYLYRFWGECQQVMDMTVTEEYIHFDTKDDQNSDEFYGSFAFVIVTTDYVDLRFCYYE
ncbi:uncharacterized protein LOC132546227 [Ylistrum balloti]|uniref:uncharacterized protein LOC132546227 n=1 Tax=Ylistrum balloti TaxID=509963 RepID=UPI002905C3DA|nr:uncharacterized protein LOC132546227 [Ylistrum balloti]